MTQTTVRLFKFNVGSPTDQTLLRMQAKLAASNLIEAMRRSLTIADKITDFTEAGHTLYVKDTDGTFRKMTIS